MYWLIAAGLAALPVLQSSSSDDDPFFFLLFMFGGGLFAIYWGWKRYRRYMLIRDTPTEKVRSMAVGRTELEGTTRLDEAPMDAPFTDDPCVFAEWSIEEYRPDSDDDGSDWETIAAGRDSMDFYLEDDTGRVLVRAGQHRADVDISDDHELTIRVDDHESPPPEIREFVQNDRDDWNLQDLLDSPLESLTTGITSGGTVANSSKDRRYKQTILPVDHHVYLLGRAEPRPVEETTDRQMGTNEDLLEMVPDSATGLFLISDRKEDSLTDYYSKMAPLAIFGGLAASAIGLYFLLDWYILV